MKFEEMKNHKNHKNRKKRPAVKRTLAVMTAAAVLFTGIQFGPAIGATASSEQSASAGTETSAESETAGRKASVNSATGQNNGQSAVSDTDQTENGNTTDSTDAGEGGDASENAAGTASDSKSDGQEENSGTGAGEKKEAQSFSDSTELKAHDTTVTVKANAEAGVLPSDARIVVTPLRKKDDDTKTLYQHVSETLQEKADKDNKSLDGFFAYAISYEVTDEDGSAQKVIPKGEVTVSLEYSDAVCPESAVDEDEISSICIRKDTDTDKWKSDDITEDKKTDIHTEADSNKLKKASVEIGDVSALSFVWSQDIPEEEKTEEAAADESNAENTSGTNASRNAGSTDRNADANDEGTGDNDADQENPFAVDPNGKKDEKEVVSDPVAEPAEATRQILTFIGTYIHETQTETTGDKNLTIYAEAPASAVPADATLAVRRIRGYDPEYQMIQEKLSEEAGKNARELTGFLAYDIAFYKDRQKIQPAAGSNIHITMKWENAAAPSETEVAESTLSLKTLVTGEDGTVSTVENLTDDYSEDGGSTSAAFTDAENKLTAAQLNLNELNPIAFTWTENVSAREGESSVQESEDQSMILQKEEQNSTSENANQKTISETNDQNGTSLNANQKNNTSENSKDGTGDTDLSKDMSNDTDSSKDITGDADSSKKRSDESDSVKDTANDADPSKDKAESTDSSKDNTESTDSLKDKAESTDSSKDNTESADSSKDTADNSDQSKEKTGSSTLSTQEGNYNVSVTWDNKTVTNIPEDAGLSITPFTESDSAWKSAKETILNAKKKADPDFDEKSLGMEALDISIVDKDGKNIEPNGKVSVSIKMNHLPEGVSDDTQLEVQHIADTNTEQTQENGLSRIIRKTVKKIGQVADEKKVETGTESFKAGEREVRIEVSGFSVFTITWQVNLSTKTRVANVKLHYVDEDGNELEDPETTPTETLYSETNEGKVTISSDWAKTVTNYDYQKAMMSDVKSGTEITGMKVLTDTSQSGTTTYNLQYTTDGTTYQNVPADAVTGSNSNTVDVYLVYKEQPHVTVHYVNEAGDDVADSDKVYAGTLTTEKQVADWTTNKTLRDGYTDYSYVTSGEERQSSAHLDSTVGTTVYSVIAENSGDNYTLKYKGSSSDTSWTTLDSNADIYLIYERTSGQGKITIHYVDIAGNPITVDGKAVTKVVYGDEWTSSDYVKYASGDDTNGYVDLLALYGESFGGYLDLNLRHVNENNSGTGLMRNGGTSQRGLVTGTNMRFLRYFKTGDHAGKLNDGGGALRDKNVSARTSDSNYFDSLDVYFFYMKPLQIHYLDSTGKKLYDTYTTTTIVPYETSGFKTNTYNADAADQSGSNATSGTNLDAVTLNSETYYNGHGTPAHIYAYNPSDSAHSAQSDITSIAWKWNSNAWQTQLSGSNTKDELITDVYMVYEESTTELPITIHHVDKNGNKISGADDTTADATSGEAFSLYKNAKKQSNSFQYVPVDGYVDSSLTTRAFPTITYTYNSASSSWKDSTSESSTAHKEVWIVYAPSNLVIHHVDENGHQIAANQDSVAIGQYIARYTDKWNGSSNVIQNNHNAGAGTWQAGHMGSYDSSNSYTSGGVFYKYDSTTGQWHTAVGSGIGSGGASGYSAVTADGQAVSESNPSTEVNPSNPSFITDLYQVYSGVKGITVHHVDTNGKKLADDTYTSVSTSNGKLTLSNQKKTDISGGYAYSAGYLDSDRNTAATTIAYNESAWTYSDGTTDGQSVPESFDQEVWLVYSKTIRVHYIHPKMNADGTVVRDSDGNPTYEAFNSSVLTDHPSNVTNITTDGANLTDTPTESNVYAKNITVDSQIYKYFGSYLAVPKTTPADEVGLPDYARLTTDAPHVRGVRLHDGTNQYLIVSGDGTAELTMTRRNQWSYMTSGGRTYTLRKNSTDGSFTMLDTQAGRSSYDMNLTKTETVDGSTVNTYIGNSGAEGVGVEYEVMETVKTGGNTYTLTVYEWANNSGNDVYQVYLPQSSNTPLVTISNEVVYSGNLSARIVWPDGLDKTHVVSYTWQRSDNGGEWTDVIRKQNGTEWNIAHDLKDRSSLNLAADDGDLSNSEGRTSVKYRVVLTYTDSSGNQKTTTSDEFSVPYWDQLENGSFEDVVVGNNTGSNAQFSNAYYKANGGVWQTTGIGDNATGTKAGKYHDKDIEIANTNSTWYQDGYAWPVSSSTAYLHDTPDYTTSGGKNVQFAELNCEAPGALYQDVITHPNEYLNYWMSHRARGGAGWNSDKALKYDTMYLVIMPTKLAMTSGTNGGELKTQDELEDFIDNHGGYDHATINTASAEETKVIWRDTNSGVLVVRITSDNMDWNNILEANGYIATSSVTRFFFVAGPTASGDNTVGNMLDAVGFSQTLPTPETPHYHMVVKKTFKGLSEADVRKLASNQADEGKAFQFTINEYTSKDSGTTLTASDKYSETNDRGDTVTSLNGAKLSFRTNGSNSFELVAKDHAGNDILTGSSTGVWTEDPDSGDITMTWTLYNNYIPSTDTKYFKVVESNADLDGYSYGTTNDGTVTDADGKVHTVASKSGMETNTVTIQDRDTARVNYTNEYRSNANNEPSLIRVQKTFSGITPTVVGNLTGAANPYKITVNNGTSDLALVANEQNPVSGSYPNGVESVSLTTKNNDDGSSTYTWTILGTDDSDTWIKSGNNYKVKEENYTPADNNPVSSISINEATSTADPAGVTITGTGTSATAEKKNINVGNESAGVTLDGTFTVSDIPEGNSATISTGTNIIIAQDKNGWLVWTPDTLGANARAAVIKKISDLSSSWSGESGIQSTVDAEHVGFRSGTNPGKISITNTDRSLTYNSDTGALSFDGGTTADNWYKYVATTYTLKRGGNTVSNEDPEIKIKNNYEPAIRVLKVDSKSHTTPLQNAKFKLYKKDSGNKYYKVSGSNISWEDTETAGDTFTTGSDGYLSPAMLYLPEGTYYLEETDAPDGYNKLTKPISFKVDASGIVTKNTDSDNDFDNGVIVGDIDWNSPYYTITVTNTAGTVLPNTGGLGSWPWILAGLLLILTASYFLYRRKRSQATYNRLMGEIRSRGYTGKHDPRRGGDGR